MLKSHTIPNAVRDIIPESLGLIYLRQNLYIFQPNGGGTDKMLTPLHIKSINDTIPLIENIAHKIKDLPTKEIITTEQFRNLYLNTSIEVNDLVLAEILTKYGSDKARHEYHLIYSVIFSEAQPKGLLEIGMGTNNETVFSNMSKYGSPGASLRAFRDFLPNTLIFGADIDKNILFEEERIKTFYVDQTNEKTFDELAAKITSQIDVIIDDGLHSPNANLQTILFAIEKFKTEKNKWLITEDIRIDSVVVFKLLSYLLDNKIYKTYIIKTKKSHVFVCHKYA
jgi:hypothetical protein